MRKRMSLGAALDCLGSADPDLRARGLHFMLRKGDDRVVAGLLRAMDDPADYVRSSAAYVLGRLGQRYDVLVAHLRSDPSARVRGACARAIPERYEGAMDAFLAALLDSDDEVVSWACISLVQMTSSDVADSLREKVIVALRHLLERQSWEARWEACTALYKIGAVDTQVIATLEALDRGSEAAKHNERAHVFRELTRDIRGDQKPVTFTIGELLQAAKEALTAQQSAL